MTRRSEIRSRISGDLDRAKELLRRSFAEEHTTEEIAGSFGIGVFITMLPTLGTGFVAFVLIAAVVDRLSKLALFASAVVFNPVVKWGVYGLSFGLGSLLIGPVEGVTFRTISLSAAPDVVARLVLGNVILAVVAAVPSYFLAYEFVETYGDTASTLLARLLAKVGLGPMETEETENPTD
jgi:uncharacterized protein (DUF2062 family)